MGFPQPTVPVNVQAGEGLILDPPKTLRRKPYIRGYATKFDLPVSSGSTAGAIYQTDDGGVYEDTGSVIETINAAFPELNAESFGLDPNNDPSDNVTAWNAFVDAATAFDSIEVELRFPQWNQSLGPSLLNFDDVLIVPDQVHINRMPRGSSLRFAYTGSGGSTYDSRFVDARATTRVALTGIRLEHTSADFQGALLDISNGATFVRLSGVELNNSPLLGVNPSLAIGLRCLDRGAGLGTPGCHNVVADMLRGGRLKNAIEAGGNSVRIQDGYFTDNTYSIEGEGSGWTITAVFEPNVNGHPNALHSTDTSGQANMVFVGCWAGDVRNVDDSAATYSWFEWQNGTLCFIGGLWSLRRGPGAVNNSPTNLVKLGADSTAAIQLMGCRIAGGNTVDAKGAIVDAALATATARPLLGFQQFDDDADNNEIFRGGVIIPGSVYYETDSSLILPAHTAIDAQAGDYTLVGSDDGKTVEINSAATQTVTIPTNASVPFAIGTLIAVYQRGAGQVTVAGAGGVTVRSPNGAKTAKQYATIGLRKRATDEWVITGDTTT